MSIFSVALTILGLAVFETVSSVDNAIINAEVLSGMGARARRWFLVWGILFAVFVVRGLLPWLIVWLALPGSGAHRGLRRRVFQRSPRARSGGGGGPDPPDGRRRVPRAPVSPLAVPGTQGVRPGRRALLRVPGGLVLRRRRGLPGPHRLVLAEGREHGRLLRGHRLHAVLHHPRLQGKRGGAGEETPVRAVSRTSARSCTSRSST